MLNFLVERLLCSNGIEERRRWLVSAIAVAENVRAVMGLRNDKDG